MFYRTKKIPSLEAAQLANPAATDPVDVEVVVSISETTHGAQVDPFAEREHGAHPGHDAKRMAPYIWRFDDSGRMVPNDFADTKEEAHVEAYPLEPRILRYAAGSVGDFRSLNYSDADLLIQLHPVEFVNESTEELESITYYARTLTDDDGFDILGPDGEPQGIEPVVREVISERHRTARGYMRHRVRVHEWFCNNGTIHPETKPMRKSYRKTAKVTEGIKRRGYLIERLSALVLDLIALTQSGAIAAQALADNPGWTLEANAAEIGDYVEDGVTLLGTDFIAAHEVNINKFIRTGVADHIVPGIAADANPATRGWLDSVVSGSPNPAHNGKTIQTIITDKLNGIF